MNQLLQKNLKACQTTMLQQYVTSTALHTEFDSFFYCFTSCLINLLGLRLLHWPAQDATQEGGVEALWGGQSSLHLCDGDFIFRGGAEQWEPARNRAEQVCGVHHACPPCKRTPVSVSTNSCITHFQSFKNHFLLQTGTESVCKDIKKESFSII